MKKEYKDIFDKIVPDENLKNKVLEKVDNKRNYTFKPKKIIAVAAAFVLIVVCGFGVYSASYSNYINNQTTTSNASNSALDFSIIAYAKDNDVNVVSNYDVTLTNIKFTNISDNGSEGYKISTESNNEGLSVRSDDDIDTVTFECENGLFSYIDNPLINYLISKKQYYTAVIPITEEQYNEYNNAVAKSGGNGAGEIKEEFVRDLLNSKDCSKYIYADNFDVSKISAYEYSVDASDMAGVNENYYDYCILIRDRDETSAALQSNTKTVVAKTYQQGDEIGCIHYYPDSAAKYLLDNPDADFSELPTDNITITVKFKNGQSITKTIITEFDSDGIMTMRCK